MRIAVLTTSYPAYEGDPSGHFVQAEVAELEDAAAGHEVRVFRPDPGGAFGWPGAPTRIRERPSRALEAGAWMLRTSFAIRRFRPDRVIAHWCVPSAFPIAMMAPQHAELEIVSHGGDVRLLCALPQRTSVAIVRSLFERMTRPGTKARWRFVSEELLDALAAALPEAERASLRGIAEIAPGALDVPDVSDDARAKRDAIAGRRLYVCAGRLVASKRVDKVIDYVATTGGTGGASALSSREERAERLLVILGDGPERPHLERLARAWQIDVRFLGTTSRRETLGWIGAADELVHASRVEGLSTVVREAEQLGVPVTIL